MTEKINAWINFLPYNKYVSSKVGERLLEVARRIGISFIGPCGGKGICGKCLVRIIEGERNLSPLTDEEKKLITYDKIMEGYRLGCKCTITNPGNIIVYVPLEFRSDEYIVLTHGLISKEKIDPTVKIIKIKVPITKEKQSFIESLISDLPLNTFHFNISSIRKASKILKEEANKELSLVIHKDEVLDLKVNTNMLGFALDIGTSKVAASLMNLLNGETLSTVSSINPQIIYGEDVISRIAYAVRGGLKNLQTSIIRCINDLIEKACEYSNTSVEDIYEIVAVGNTVMHHLLLGINPQSLAYFPYIPVTRNELYINANDIGINVNEYAKLYLPPLIAGYIGSDVVADIIATGMYKDRSPTILIDIGTNTEIVIQKSGLFLACSTAAGPAFEGAHVTFGMRAAKGAIWRIQLSSNGEVFYSIIGDEKPKGIAGSAIIDAISELYKAGLIDSNGKLVTKNNTKRLRDGKHGYPEFVIAYKNETAIDDDITLTQKDVREIQLAKAAIRAGIEILLKKAGVRIEDIERIYVAGAFGFYLNPISAVNIGLFPKEVDVERISFVGNTALTGAKAILLSNTLREEIKEIIEKVEYIELAMQPDFQKEFIKAIPFPKI